MNLKEQRQVAKKTVAELLPDLTFVGKASLSDTLSHVKKVNGKYRSGCLSSLWRNLHKLRDEKSFLPELTMKQKGQFTQMEKKAGDRTPEAIQNVVLNWELFRTLVKKDAGVKTVPKKPSIGWTLRYISIAVNMTDIINQNDTIETPVKIDLTSEPIKSENVHEPADKEMVSDLLKDI